VAAPIAAGEVIGCFATVERPGAPDEAQVQARVEGGKLTGVKVPVTDGDVADLAVVLAKEGGGRALPGRSLGAPACRARRWRPSIPPAARPS
jgi:alkylation response protein AidB-like acyl-CoA dehydrogenase